MSAFGHRRGPAAGVRQRHAARSQRQGRARTDQHQGRFAEVNERGLTVLAEQVG